MHYFRASRHKSAAKQRDKKKHKKAAKVVQFGLPLLLLGSLVAMVERHTVDHWDAPS